MPTSDASRGPVDMELEELRPYGDVERRLREAGLLPGAEGSIARKDKLV